MARMIQQRGQCEENNFSLLLSAKNLLVVLTLRLQSSVSVTWLWALERKAGITGSEAVFISDIQMNVP